MNTSPASLLVALATAAVIGTTAAGPAAADTSDPSGRSIVHRVPKVPLVVDGVSYAPKKIHRFDGRRLYFAATARNQKKLLAFTKLGRYKAYLKRTAGLRFKPGTLEPVTGAHASRAGDYVDYFDHQALGGASFRINSGWAVADLRAVPRGCNILGCAGTWDNQITSVRAVGRGTMLFEHPAFTGAPLWLPTYSVDIWDLWQLGFNDTATSVWAAWE